jgi:hypothetical protein
VYMLYQQYTTAILDAYRGSLDLAHHVAAANTCREWLESLEISPPLRDALLEPLCAIEEAFEDLLVHRD